MTQKISLTVWCRRWRSAEDGRGWKKQKSRQEGVEHRRAVAPVGTHATATRAASGKGAFPFRSGRSVAITWRAGQRGIRTGP
ncbi:hypothetical protein IE987_19290 [Klebsiella pneumoniae]|uniref:Uncharacterized protein n=1 Tax=Klebsiella pneumoniae TaxID=573 RepID=A0A927DKJ7_KLEPN|nr:hypothetical protein [Klebsiella pneumoniae]